MEEALQRHEQGIVIQPPAVLAAETLILRVLTDIAALIGLVQQSEPVVIELVKVHLGRVGAEIHGIALLLCQHTFFDQCFQADHIRVSGEG